MSYQPGIPTGLIPLNEDYLNIQQNFTQLADQFEEDHVPLTSTSGSPPNGYHLTIHQVPFSTVASNPPNNYNPVSLPTGIGGFGEIVTAQVNDGINTDESLFYVSGGGKRTQLTMNFTPSITPNGSTSLPGGVIMNWGGGTIGTGLTPYTFSQPFPNLVFAIIITGQTNSSPTNDVYVRQDSITINGFKVSNFSASITAVNWIAIGN